MSNHPVAALSCSEDQTTRCDLVLALPERIQAIPDGTLAAKQSGGWATSGSHKNIKFDSPDGDLDSNFFLRSEESSQFRNEYEMRKLKQDQCLDFIFEGLDTLKNLAQDMNEEMDRQVPPMDEIDTKARSFCFSRHLSIFRETLKADNSVLGVHHQDYCGAFIGGQGNI